MPCRCFSFIVLFYLLGNNCYSQQDTTYRGLPVVPFEEFKADTKTYSPHSLVPVEKKSTFRATLQSRARAFDFFRTMAVIAEPTTVSFLPLDWTVYDRHALQKKPLVLNADVRTPITLGGKGWGMHTIHILPHFKVRIFQDDTVRHSDRSMPVRTPSYLPGVIWYFSHLKLWTRAPVNNSLEGYYGGIHVFHHSNGQDGPEFLDLNTIRRLRLNNVQTGELNTYNGNFSETIVFDFIVGGVYEFYRKRNDPKSSAAKEKSETAKLPQARTTTVAPHQPNHMFYWRASYEWHEKKHLTNRSFIIDGKESVYGRDRFNLHVGYSFIPTYRDLILNDLKDAYVAVTPFASKEFIRITLSTNYLTNTDYHVGDLSQRTKVPFWDIGKRLNASLTGYWRLTGAPNAALFLQASRIGSDNYNIYFQQSYWQFRGGIAMAFFKYPMKEDTNILNEY